MISPIKLKHTLEDPWLYSKHTVSPVSLYLWFSYYMACSRPSVWVNEQKKSDVYTLFLLSSSPLTS